MRGLERMFHKGDRSEKLDRQIIVGKTGQDSEIMHPQTDLGRWGGDEVTSQGY